MAPPSSSKKPSTSGSKKTPVRSKSRRTAAVIRGKRSGIVIDSKKVQAGEDGMDDMDAMFDAATTPEPANNKNTKGPGSGGQKNASSMVGSRRTPKRAARKTVRTPKSSVRLSLPGAIDEDEEYDDDRSGNNHANGAAAAAAGTGRRRKKSTTPSEAKRYVSRLRSSSSRNTAASSSWSPSDISQVSTAPPTPSSTFQHDEEDDEEDEIEIEAVEENEGGAEEVSKGSNPSDEVAQPVDDASLSSLPGEDAALLTQELEDGNEADQENEEEEENEEEQKEDTVVEQVAQKTKTPKKMPPVAQQQVEEEEEVAFPGTDSSPMELEESDDPVAEDEDVNDLAPPVLEDTEEEGDEQAEDDDSKTIPMDGSVDNPADGIQDGTAAEVDPAGTKNDADKVDNENDENNEDEEDDNDEEDHPITTPASTKTQRTKNAKEAGSGSDTESDPGIDNDNDHDNEGDGYNMVHDPETPKSVRKERARKEKEKLRAKKKKKTTPSKRPREHDGGDDDDSGDETTAAATTATPRRTKKSKKKRRVAFSPTGIPIGNREYEAVPIADLVEESPKDKSLRRSKRAKCKPLAFWKNEKLEYGAHSEAGDLGEAMGAMPVVTNVIRALPTPYKKVKRAAPVVKARGGKSKRKKNAPSESEDDEETSRRQPVDQSKIPFDIRKLPRKYKYMDGETAHIWDDVGDVSIDQKVIALASKMQSSNLPIIGERSEAEGTVVGKAAQAFNIPNDENNDNYPGYIMGNLLLPPKGIKDAESVGPCSQTFTVCRCQPRSLEVAFGNPDLPEGTLDPETAQRFLLGPGDLFRVPPGNSYRLANHSDTTDCLLSWTIIKPRHLPTPFSAAETAS